MQQLRAIFGDLPGVRGPQYIGPASAVGECQVLSHIDLAAVMTCILQYAIPLQPVERFFAPGAVGSTRRSPNRVVRHRTIYT